MVKKHKGIVWEMLSTVVRKLLDVSKIKLQIYSITIEVISSYFICTAILISTEIIQNDIMLPNEKGYIAYLLNHSKLQQSMLSFHVQIVCILIYNFKTEFNSF